jgi:hypothetical protein
MQTLIGKKNAFVIMLTTGLIILNPASANNDKSKEWIQAGVSEELEEISIKNIRKMGDQEFSYQNKDNNIILVKCDKNKILVRYWYFTKLKSANSKEATSKMQWHRAVPRSRIQVESEFVCNYS